MPGLPTETQAQRSFSKHYGERKKTQALHRVSKFDPGEGCTYQGARKER